NIKQSSISKKTQINKNTTQDALNYPLSENDPESSFLLDAENDNDKELVYEIKDLKELVAMNFLNCEESKYIKFLVIIKLNNKFIEKALSNERD
ncbi:14718_t:CDS:1, partial [Racocetra fulgida]